MKPQGGTRANGGKGLPQARGETIPAAHGEVSSNYAITSSGSAGRSAAFDPQAASVGIGRTVGTIRTARPEGIGDRVRRVRRAVAAQGVTRRIGIVRVGVQPATIISLLVIDPWRVGGERIRRRLVAERTAVGAEGIVDAVRFEGASGSEGIGRRVGRVRIRA